MKKLLVVVAAVAFGAVAQASELWWTVATNPTTVDGVPQTWTIAKLFANDSGDTKNFGGTLVDAGIADDLKGGGGLMSDISGYGSASSFYVELWNSDQLVGKSYISMNNPNMFANQGAASMANIAGNVYSGNIMDTPPSSPYSFATFTTSNVIPEPTSGLLMALGMMMLALKRRRV